MEFCEKSRSKHMEFCEKLFYTKLMEQILKRKVNDFLLDWKNRPNHLPLIIKGARQIGKTSSIEHFSSQYENFVEINFVEEPRYKQIFDDGFSVNDIIKQISFINQSFNFVPGKTLILFDELQACPNCATCLKFFKIDGRFDVICSGSLMGINYKEIESNSVGYKEEYEMSSMDFEEFLWAKGFTAEQIEDLYSHMKNLSPFSELELSVMFDNFREYMVLGGMPAVIKKFVSQNNYSGTLQIQKNLLKDYEEDITKYAQGLDKGKIKNVYNNISVFLAKENKKFQVSKISKNARNRDYVGTVEWLNDAGIINVCYCLDELSLPLKGNYEPKNYKIYYRDTGLLIASLEEEAQNDLRLNKNFNTYKGAIYENIVADMLVKSGYNLYYYKNEKSTIEIDFFLRDANSLVPVEVKANDNPTASLNKVITDEKFSEVKYGIKLCYKNIGFNGKFYTFPYFLTFLLKRFLLEEKISHQ